MVGKTDPYLVLRRYGGIWLLVILIFHFCYLILSNPSFWIVDCPLLNMKSMKSFMRSLNGIMLITCLVSFFSMLLPGICWRLGKCEVLGYLALFGMLGMVI